MSADTGYRAPISLMTARLRLRAWRPEDLAFDADLRGAFHPVRGDRLAARRAHWGHGYATEAARAADARTACLTAAV
jgi:RimJ/RimL family protein N-acetyltransferase